MPSRSRPVARNEIPSRVYRGLPADAQRFYDETRIEEALRGEDLKPDPQLSFAESFLFGFAIAASFAFLALLAYLIFATFFEPAFKRQGLAAQEHFTAGSRAIN